MCKKISFQLFICVRPVKKRLLNVHSFFLQRAHQLQPLPTRELLVVQQEININRLWNILTSILIERPPGSENIVKVKDVRETFGFVCNYTQKNCGRVAYFLLLKQSLLFHFCTSANRPVMWLMI